MKHVPRPRRGTSARILGLIRPVETDPAPDLRAAIWRGEPPVLVVAASALSALGLRRRAARLLREKR